MTSATVQNHNTDRADPFSTGDASPVTAIPEDACDCHMHVFDDSYPAVPDAPIKSPNASLAQYQALQKRMGHGRFVLVQPSVYGLDNSLLLKVLSQHRTVARGVAVINQDTAADETEALDQAGIKGVRFNLVQRGVTHESMLVAVAEKIRRLGWHIDVQMLPKDLLAHEEVLRGLHVPVVIDHLALVHRDAALDAEVEACVHGLMSGGNVWVKLSGPYIAARPGSPGYGELARVVRKWTNDFPERLVWGSDWPHGTEQAKPDDARLLDFLIPSALPAKVRNRILVDNPAQLYGFAPSGRQGG